MWQAIRDFMAWYQATIVIWVTIPIFTILLPWGIWRRYFYRLPDGSSPPKPNPALQAFFAIYAAILFILYWCATSRVFE
jgi:hypothetical protein